MGVENNECVVATIGNEEMIENIRLWIGKLPEDQRQLFAIIPSLINGKQTVVLGPDGSKKGWEEAERGEVLRNEFIAQLIKYDYSDGSNPFDYIEVGYGEFGQKVLRGNCKNCYNDSEYAEI